MFRREYLQKRIADRQAELKEMGEVFSRLKAHNEREKERLLVESGLKAQFNKLDDEVKRWTEENQKKADNISGRIFELKELLAVLTEFEEQHAEELAELESQEDQNEFYVKDTDQ